MPTLNNLDFVVLRKLRRLTFFLGIGLYVAALVAPTAPAGTGKMIIGAGLFLTSLFMVVASGCGVVALLRYDPEMSVVSNLSDFYLASLFLSNIPIFLLIFRYWPSREGSRTVPRWLTNAMLAAGAYASLLPFIPSVRFEDIRLPSGLWLFSLLSFCVFAMLSSFENWLLRSGLCRVCCHDLRGNVSGRCPECGRAIELTRKGDG